MEYDKNLIHYVTATVILVKDGKYLIAKRADWEKAFPNKWTVPGGKLEVLDYALREKDTGVHWYNIVEDLCRREVLEEVGLDFKNLEYLTSLVFVRKDKIPVLVLSFWAEPVGEVLDGHDSSKDDPERPSGEPMIKLCSALTEYKWVTLEEAKNYDLIEGIYEELEMLDKNLRRSAYPKNLNEGAKTGKVEEWKKNDGFQSY